MTSIKVLILKEIYDHPKAEIIDLIKLIYQHCFGGEHMIIDESYSIKSIQKEFEAIGYSNKEELYCDIGGGYVRLNLKYFRGSKSEINTINRIFTAGHLEKNQNEDYLKTCLDLLSMLAMQNLLPFTPTEVSIAIASYLSDGIRAVSHSKEYKENYAPAYRVVEKKYVKILKIINQIEKKLLNGDNIIMAIDGMCGSGKSTIAKTLKALYNGAVIELDHFFLPPQLRTTHRLEEIGGNIDYNRFINQVIAPLKAKKTFSYDIFDCSSMDFSGKVTIPQNQLIICEGSYSLNPKFAFIYNLKVFVECSGQIQLERIKARNTEASFKRFVDEWIPMENKYFNSCNIKNSCDVLINTN